MHHSYTTHSLTLHPYTAHSLTHSLTHAPLTYLTLTHAPLTYLTLIHASLAYLTFTHTQQQKQTSPDQLANVELANTAPRGWVMFIGGWLPRDTRREQRGESCCCVGGGGATCVSARVHACVPACAVTNMCARKLAYQPYTVRMHIRMRKCAEI